MKLSEIKNHLHKTELVNFKLISGASVPAHFHITEIGVIDKHFIDCGGTERFEKYASFQLWNANDTAHRLQPQKLLNIISLSEKVLRMDDMEIEVEYQTDTIGKYDLRFNGKDFVLVPKHTACLASDACGVADKKQEIKLSALNSQKSCCTPGGGCC
jgi:hypothetical protein